MKYNAVNQLNVVLYMQYQLEFDALSCIYKL